MSRASGSRATVKESSERIQSPQPVVERGAARPERLAVGLRILPLVVALVALLVAGAYQLELPGLHYDEAKEAGVNAMQLLTGQPVSAFRGATVSLGPWRLPLMVQDYIGNLNVLFAIPFLAAGGVNPVALRTLPLVLAALTLFVTWKIAHRLGGPHVAAVAALLLAVNPTFIFWSRQGIFVTNVTALFFMVSLWFGLIWWEERSPAHLILAALFCGLGVYAKLLFVWAAIAMFLVAAFGLLMERRVRGHWSLPKPSSLALGGVAFLLPLAPLILYNLRTGGTLISIFGNLEQSYYGVDNSAYGSNLLARLNQLVVLLRGDHFWYLGGAHANEYAPWLFLALVLLATAAWSRRRPGEQAAESKYSQRLFAPALPLALLLLIVLQSAFTVSDLFITHFALLTPLIPLVAALSLGEVGRWARVQTRTTAVAGTAAAVLVVAWIATDVQIVVLYHRGLTISGGYAAHSDAIYALAEYLDTAEYRSPVALDWGIDAPVRFLTRDRVQPIDVFGYGSTQAPEQSFMARLAPYLDDPETIYVAPPPEKAIFKGRLEMIEALRANGSVWLEQTRFSQRSGDAVFFVHRFFR